MIVLLRLQVVKCYPSETASYASQVMELLDTHYAVLDSGLRRVLVQVCLWEGSRWGPEEGAGAGARARGGSYCKEEGEGAD